MSAMFEGTNWTTVFVALATGSAAACGPLLLWSRQVKRERESVRASLLAEVSALLEIVKRRNYVRDLRATEVYLKTLSPDELKLINVEEFGFSLPVGENYNRVYQANVSRLGALSATEATQIVRFHQFADSVRADVSSGGVLAIGSVDHESYGETAGILEAAIEIGTQLTKPPLSRWQRMKIRFKK